MTPTRVMWRLQVPICAVGVANSSCEMSDLKIQRSECGGFSGMFSVIESQWPMKERAHHPAVQHNHKNPCWQTATVEKIA